MRKMMMALMVAVLCVAVAAPGFARTTAYDAAQRFIQVLEADQLTCEPPVVDETGGTHILVRSGEYTFDVCFRVDEEQAEIRVQPVIAFDDADVIAVLRAVNDLNGSYKYVRFYVGEDNTVICAMNLMLYDGGDAGEIALQGMTRMTAVLQVARPQLAMYEK